MPLFLAKFEASEGSRQCPFRGYYASWSGCCLCLSLQKVESRCSVRRQRCYWILSRLRPNRRLCRIYQCPACELSLFHADDDDVVFDDDIDAVDYPSVQSWRAARRHQWTCPKEQHSQRALRVRSFLRGESTHSLRPPSQASVHLRSAMGLSSLIRLVVNHVAVVGGGGGAGGGGGVSVLALFQGFIIIFIEARGARVSRVIVSYSCCSCCPAARVECKVPPLYTIIPQIRSRMLTGTVGTIQYGTGIVLVQ